MNNFIFFCLPFFLVKISSAFYAFSLSNFFQLFAATFTCVVNNLGGYRVSGDAASARVGTFCRIC